MNDSDSVPHLPVISVSLSMWSRMTLKSTKLHHCRDGIILMTGYKLFVLMCGGRGKGFKNIYIYFIFPGGGGGYLLSYKDGSRTTHKADEFIVI